MIKGKNIVCISSIDWDFVWQGHQEIMSTFAKNGNTVLFIENTGIRPPTIKDIPRLKKRIMSWIKSFRGFRQEREGLYIFSPVILPFPYSRIAGFFNRFLLVHALKRWMAIMKFDNPIVWTFLPTGTALDIIHGINPSLVVYYYIADFDFLTKNYKKLRKYEERLMSQCDVIFVQGEYFKERCLKFNDNVFIYPFGVNTKMFEDFKNDQSSTVPGELEKLEKPIIGYVGGVHHHIDFDLVKKIAVSHPDWSMVFVGPKQTSTALIDDIENIHFLEKKEFSELPAYINQFDVCIVPYLISDFTRTVYPTKINEYHVMGKPVISTKLPEAEKANSKGLVLFAKDHEEFIKRIEDSLSDNNSELEAKRIAVARLNSWSNRIQEMSSKMEEVLVDKNIAITSKWQNILLALYRRSRNRIIKLGLAASFIWLMVFYTPLFWFLAEPLKFSDSLKQADAIVVFAGGVGETGKAGQGYEERVDYAVELFNQGLSQNMIFSSAARSTFPEPYVMKALAVSLGVPSKSIMLEDKASSTYENVRRTNEILAQRGFAEIILISSPYHMRRASLVFKKLAPDVKVIYAPLPDSQFYERNKYDEDGKRVWKKINTEQIKGIVHEYLAIMYYKLKGKI